MLYVIGIGPGNPEYMTEEAARTLAKCELVVGYPLYLEFVKKQYPEKEYYGTPMTREIERCRYALDMAKTRPVALVCSGDAGVYGMAGPVLELASEYPETEIRVIAGVTSALGGAAVLGAPLMHDFAVISLSDRLTPMEEIRRKLKAAAESGFVIALYNPSSKKRRDYLRMACDILLTCLAPSTVCGYVRNVGRDDPESGILTLEELKNFEADMFTTVFVGNSRTKVVHGRMVTPRGYGEKIQAPAGAAETGSSKMQGIDESISSVSGTEFHKTTETIPPKNAAEVSEISGEISEAAGTEKADDRGNVTAAVINHMGISGGTLVAAGTTEGRRLCEYFAKRGQTVYAFVATEYGEEMLPESPYILPETGRKNADEMFAFLREHEIVICYDAMHPYATLAHKNMKEACERSGCAYTRVLRERGPGGKEAEAGTWNSEIFEPGKAGDRDPETSATGEKTCAEIVRTGSVREAAEYLKNQEGNIFVTTGSRELAPFTEIENYEERIWVRVLPSVESLEACRKAGIPGKQIIAMHGPFSGEMNELILREHEIRWMVTKDSGKAGGFLEKLEAAAKAGTRVILVERPQDEPGITLQELILQLERN